MNIKIVIDKNLKREKLADPNLGMSYEERVRKSGIKTKNLEKKVAKLNKKYWEIK